MDEARRSEPAIDHQVVVAGGGPTGLMLGAELHLGGADVLIVERRLTQELDGSRAGGLHARSLEVLEQRGVADRFVAEGQTYPSVGFAQIPLDISDLPSRHNHLLGLWQNHLERILAGWVLDELGVPIVRGVDVVGLRQDADGVDVDLSDGRVLRAAYLVGCDGGRSVVRKAAGIGFPGLDASTSWLLAEVEMDEQPPLGMRPEGGGIGPADPTRPDGPYRIVFPEPEPRRDPTPTVDELRALLVATYGTDYGMHEPTWLTRFSDASRQADAYRAGRVLVAGDAAHIHPPQGGQGLNVGLQDAVNLGWKLARVVSGTAADELLDTYHDERHPVGARVQHNTQAQVAIGVPDARHQSLRETLADLLAMDEPRRQLAAMVSGLDVHYDLGEPAGDPVHALVGRRMPDLDLTTADGPTRVSTLLHGGDALLLVLGDRADHPTPDVAGWDRVRVVAAAAAPSCELPLLGVVDVPSAVLVRPDGHVAWTGTPADPALRLALVRWFGERRDPAA